MLICSQLKLYLINSISWISVFTVFQETVWVICYNSSKIKFPLLARSASFLFYHLHRLRNTWIEKNRTGFLLTCSMVVMSSAQLCVVTFSQLWRNWWRRSSFMLFKICKHYLHVGHVWYFSYLFLKLSVR